jgi:hypothetical protein
MNEHYYLYALTRAGPIANLPGAGVDPRFPVETVSCRQTTGVVSQVGLDRFDVRKLESENTDVNWLSEVAIRHNRVISDVALRQPLLPLRLGALFRTRSSLLDKIEFWEPVVIDFLDSIGDRQEWSAKIYIAPNDCKDDSTEQFCHSNSQAATLGAGARYLAQKRNRQRESNDRHKHFKEEIAVMETSLMNQADRYCRTRPLPANLTGRPDKMLWNAAYLLPRSASQNWLHMAEEVRAEAASRGFLLEISGPWPPYHFCPNLDS